MLYTRDLQKNIEKWLFRGKILIVYGARQVGKTTLARTILEKFGNDGYYYNCEMPQVQLNFSQTDPIKLKEFLGNKKVIVLDEAQRVLNIGLKLKLLIDTFPQMQIIATGSSSFDLSNKINEPLTGRALDFRLFPLSFNEIKQKLANHEVDSKLESLLRFGSYPEIFTSDEQSKVFLLNNISSKYLYKDILEFEQIKKSQLLLRLLQSLSLQIGNEVSINELSTKLEVSSETIQRYLNLLEKTFVIFSIGAFSRNLRNEITKKRKYYFYDLGIRNSLIDRFSPLEIRDDIGSLWENFCVAERLKLIDTNLLNRKQYFWRTHDQKEIDYLEEYDGKISGYEFKWTKNKINRPQIFLDNYPNSTIEVINKDNYTNFLSLLY